jgi:type IV pilus assembly protein PilF
MNAQIIKLLLIMVSLSLIACSWDNSASSKMSNAEKATTYLDMGVRYMEIGQLKSAKENLEKALDLETSNADMYNALAVLNEKLKEPNNARQYYEKSLNIDPNNPQSQNNYGRYLCEQGNYAEGMIHLNIALNMPLNNRRWFALTNAGRCLLKQGDKIQAEAYFRESLLLQPNYHPALLEMLKLSFHEGKTLSAQAFLQRYQSLTGMDAEALWYAIQIELALDHKTIADKYRYQLLNEFPMSEEAKRIRNAINN